MTLFLIVAAAALAVAQIFVPRRFALVPLLIAACHVPNLPILPSLTVVRLLILVGLIRAVVNGGVIHSPRHSLDRWFVVWAGWAILSSFAHQAKDYYNPITVHLSMVFDYVGTYLFARAYLTNRDDIMQCCKWLAMVLVALAVLLWLERISYRNPYSILGAQAEVWVRGKVRAMGPFGNPMLAGIVGAASFPLMMALRQQSHRLADIGMAACVLIALASNSSTPIMSLLAGVGALFLWRWRHLMGRIRVAAIVMLAVLAAVMEAPIWYLIARIDITGGSTSWHRAELVHQAFEHLEEWWLVGTDYTRHWMPYGIEWSADHVDITNHYVNFGVRGGLLLMGSFIVILVKAFQSLGRQMQMLRTTRSPGEFMFWCLGASLFVHVFTFLGISYFDQSYVFFCLVVGAVSGLCAVTDRPQPVLKH